MKQGLKLAFVYIGLVIGAGFASGREVFEFFNLTSNTNHSHIVLATFLFMIICYIILDRAYTDNIKTYKDYLFALTSKAEKFIRIFMAIYLFCGFFTMLSGSGALLHQFLNFPTIIGSLIMAGICFFTLIYNIEGIVALNTILVPLMIIGIIFISLISALRGVPSGFFGFGETKNMLLSSIIYVSYNTISAPAVLVPLQKNLNPKEIRVASVTGGFALGLLIMVVWLVQGLSPEIVSNSQIPMLAIANSLGKGYEIAYSLVLFMAICTTAVSQSFAIVEYFPKVPRKIRSATLCLVAIPFSLIGFSTLVAKLYTFFGVLGIVWMIFIFADYIKNR